jgi:RimJ/RimL family protein N-acetyltransferase
MDVQEEMTQRGKIEPEVSIHLRPVIESDLPILFEYQREPEANEMAGFPPRDHDHNVASIRVLEKCGFAYCAEATGALGEPADGVEEFVYVFDRAESKES